jgi:hypothetical protein
VLVGMEGAVVAGCHRSFHSGKDPQNDWMYQSGDPTPVESS